MLRKSMILCLLFVCCISISITKAQNENEVSSKINAVTVYP